MQGNSKTTRYKKTGHPLAYYLFWAILIAICLGLVWCAYNNIYPYMLVARKVFRLSSEPGQFVQILWFRIQLSMAWVVGAIFWAILQGFQVAYLLLTQSEKALDFLINKAKSHKYHEINDGDYNTLKDAKHQYNTLPLATLVWLKTACLCAYVIEFFVNIDTYPLVNGGTWGFLMAIFLFQWNRIRLDNLAMVLLTLFAVEGLVFAAIMTYRIIDVFKQSKAYRPATNQQH